MESLRCNDGIATGATVPDAGKEELRRLPQFFCAGPDYMYRLGGPVYRGIIDAMQFSSRKRFISIDSRIHMLHPGWYSCIPGWHCDDFYRPPGHGGQPDLISIAENERLRCRHHAVVIGDVAPTEYIIEPFDLPLSAIDTTAVHRSIDAHIDAHVTAARSLVRSREIVSFGSFDFHRGTKSEGAGWRLFLRATESDIREPRNELRTQAQVYLRDTGW